MKQKPRASEIAILLMIIALTAFFGIWKPQSAHAASSPTFEVTTIVPGLTWPRTLEPVRGN